MESRDAAQHPQCRGQPVKQGIAGFRESSVLRLTNLDKRVTDIPVLSEQ